MLEKKEVTNLGNITEKQMILQNQLPSVMKNLLCVSTQFKLMMKTQNKYSKVTHHAFVLNHFQCPILPLSNISCFSLLFWKQELYWSIETFSIRLQEKLSHDFEATEFSFRMRQQIQFERFGLIFHFLPREKYRNLSRFVSSQKQCQWIEQKLLPVPCYNSLLSGSSFIQQLRAGTQFELSNSNVNGQ